MRAHKHRHHTQSRARDSVSFVFSFFLSIALVGVMVLTMLRLGVFTKGGLLDVFDDQYYEYVLSYTEEQAKYYTLPTGIDPQVLDDVFELSEVRENVDDYIASLFLGYEYEPDVSAARDRLAANVRNAFASDGVSVSESKDAQEGEQVASTYVDEIMTFYADMMKPTGLDSVMKVRSLYCKYFPYVMLGLVVFAIIMMVLLRRLHHFLHRSLRYMAYSLGGAALMGFVVPMVLFAMGSYKGLNLTPQYFYHFGVTAIERVLILCMMGSAVLAAVMAVLVFAIARLRKGALRSGHMHSGHSSRVHE